MSHPRRRLGVLAFGAAALIAVGGQPAYAVPARVPAQLPTQAAAATFSPEVRDAERHDTSKSLTEIAADLAQAEKAAGGSAARAQQKPGGDSEQRLGRLPRNSADPDAKTGSSNVQTTDIGTASFPEFGANFEGVGNLDGVLPPDTNGDVGPNHYVQMINIHFAVYSKSGALLLGPLPNNALWSGFGGPCQTRNDGDPVVLYDEAADRWMMSQFALPGGAAGNHQCMAISQTGDPTGAWYRYDFLYHATRVNDYPKYGIWQDAYYMTTNEFAPAFVGAGAVAYEREKMLAGQPARQVYFHLGPEFGGLLPADAEGLAPPAGAPNPFVMFDDDAFGISPTDRLMIWDFAVNWTNPAASTFGVDGVPNRFLETAPFDSNMCNYARNCVPQQGTAQRLDAISDRLMFRAAYRNFGNHASIVLNQTVDVDGADHAGVRWYELRSTGTGWTIHQQGTYAPDGEHRWMGSAAIDVNGNIAIGYSASSTTSFPSIRVAGRLAGDPLGQLTQGERTLIAGGGAQTHSAARWGDYSSMSVDPTDGCTFWFTTEYLTTTSSADWKTRIGSAKFPTCQAGPTGVVTGTVTDAGTGAPIAGATVSTGSASTVTGTDGKYSFTLPVGDYQLSASAYAYVTQTAAVTITDGGTTTKNFALAAAPRATIRGKVTDGSGHGYPLYARIDIAGRPGGPIFSDPGTGNYSVEVAAGATYQMTVKAMFPGYQTVQFPLAVGSGDVTRNVSVPVDAAACIAAGYRVNFGTPLISESFSTTTTPPGWSVVDRTTSGGWRFTDVRNRGNLTGGTGGYAIADSDAPGSGTTIDTDLLPPALDLSGVPTPYLQFNSDYRAFSNGFADVDVSLNGGTTWTTLSHFTTTDRRGPRVEQIPLTGAGGAADVRVRFHYRGNFAWWWEVDNVQVVNRSCDPVPGGLLVGFTNDANTGAGVNGVTVSSGDVQADKAVSAATPEDTSIGDGFYWMFSSVTGTHPFTAAKPPYKPSTASVNVAANGTTRHDFSLAAGRLDITPAGVTSNQPFGSTRTGTVTIKNTGGATAEVELLERSGGFDMLGQQVGAKLSMRRVKGGVSKAMTGVGSGEVGAPSPAVDNAWTSIKNYPVSVFDNSAAVFDGKVYSVAGGSGTGNERKAFVYDPDTDAWTALPDMPTARAKPQAAFMGGKLYVIGGWNASGTPIPSVDVFDPVAGTWSTLSGATNPKPRAAAGVGVVDGKIYLVGGCTDSLCSDASDTVVFDPATGGFAELAAYPHPSSWMSCGGIAGKIYCAGGVGASTFTDGHVYDPGANTWTAIANMPLDLWGSQYASAGGMLVIAGGVTAASTTITNRTVAYDPASNTWLNLPNAQHTRFRGAGACGAYKIGGSPSSFVGSADSERLGGLEQCDEATDVPWLAGAPGSFALAPGESQTVTVTLTATPEAGVEQPGAYTAEFGVRSDTPYQVPAIGVEMNVAPPKAWGKVQGTIVGQPCTGGPVPLAATVRIRTLTAPGGEITLRSDNQGKYEYWLSKAQYEVLVAKDGWNPDSRRITLGQGKTVTVNFTLTPSNPCSAGPGGS